MSKSMFIFPKEKLSIHTNTYNKNEKLFVFCKLLYCRVNTKYEHTQHTRTYNLNIIYYTLYLFRLLCICMYNKRASIKFNNFFLLFFRFRKKKNRIFPQQKKNVKYPFYSHTQFLCGYAIK